MQSGWGLEQSDAPIDVVEATQPNKLGVLGFPPVALCRLSNE
jgi:hypothetical protein